MNDTTNIDRIMRGLNEVADIVEGKARPARVKPSDHCPAVARSLNRRHRFA